MGHLVLKERYILRNNTRRMVEIRDSSNPWILKTRNSPLCFRQLIFLSFQAFEFRNLTRGFPKHRHGQLCCIKVLS